MMTLGMGRVGMRGLAGLLAGLVACSSTEPAGGEDGTNGTVPAELVGSWYYGSVSPTNYYNPGSGQWSNAYGEGMFYTFKADGTFEFGYEVQAGSYGCTNTVMWYKSGGVNADPSAQTVTVRPRVALLNSKDNCRPEWNYEKEIDKSPEQLSWRFGQDDWGYDALFLRFPSGEEIAFYRWDPGAGLGSGQ
jgi:hypothetical protein